MNGAGMITLLLGYKALRFGVNLATPDIVAQNYFESLVVLRSTKRLGAPPGILTDFRLAY
jgi:hypothetical protein